MHRQKQILLLVDNKKSFLDIQAEWLVDEGYQVLTADSIPVADERLQEKWVHLAILDIRMIDDDDAEDISGLLWAQKDLYQSLPIIILTSYDKEYIRETFDLVLDDKANIVGFVSKPDGPVKLQDAVKYAFEKKIKINWDLVIRWNPTYSPNHLISLIEPKIIPSLLEGRVKEFEDVLRQLFFDFTQVTLGRIISTASGHVILEAFAYNEVGKETQYVVSCGQRAIIADENERNKVMPKGKGKGSTRWANELSLVETIRFAATGYHLVDGDLEAMTSFSTYYRYNEAMESVQALNHLYYTTLAPWYEGGLSQRQYAFPDFVTHIPFENPVFADSLAQKIESLCKQTLIAGVAKLKCESRQLSFQIAGNGSVSYSLPTYNLLAALPAQQILCGTVHGSVNGHSVRLDRQGTTWLINFTQAGAGELLRDFALLETHIKFDWLRSVSVSDRYLFEKRLLRCEKLDEMVNIDGLSAEPAKALTVISHLRQLAAHYLGPDSKPYLLSLCAYTLSHLDSLDPAIRYTRGELEPYAHALLSMAMLCNALSTQGETGGQLPPQAQRGLWLDERNKCVWVEGKEISLTPQEYDLLAFLYQNRNQLCTRDSIAHQVWQEDEEPVWSKSRLDTTIGRIRQKIELTPKKPKHLITIRGQGYKLIA